jgi:predicted nucleic acid-binding Zn ribbon protein
MPDSADPRDAASAIRSTFGGDASDLPETIATYLRLRGLEPSARSFRKKRRRTEDDENAPFTPGRDPRGIGDVMASLTRDSGWNAQLAREDVVRSWNEVAGADTAGHTRPVAFADGTLTVQADSTAWAKQLQLMRAHILSEIVRRFPDAGVEGIRFIGPDVPSWKWGPRAIPGRGPRDTYG